MSFGCSQRETVEIYVEICVSFLSDYFASLAAVFLACKALLIIINLWHVIKVNK